MATAKQELKVSIPAPNIQAMMVEIKGTSPIIFNQFPKKAIRQMEEKQQKTSASLKNKDVRQPINEYRESFYRDSEGRVALPALNIKQAIVGSSRNIAGVTMTLLRGAVFVAGDADGLIPVLAGGKEVRVTQDPEMLADDEQPATGIIGLDPSNSDVAMRRDMVRLAGMGSPADMRYRGQLSNWSMKFMVKYNADVLTAEWVLNLLQIAGFASGLGEWRPEKNGASGTFEIASE